MAADCEGSEPGPVAEIAVGEEGERVKPFTPEKAREIVMSLQQPAVFCNMVFDWPARHWTAEHLSEVLWGKQIRFRMGLRSTDTVPQFETSCSYVDATLEEFLTWNRNQSSTSGPFKDYDHSKFWAYADYKYFVTLFEDKTDVFQEVVWSDFGFPGRNGQESTLWIGSLGAHTPCHLDSYGCNLVFQVQGRKRWHLFPPEDTPFLYPTRIPYEESSVFSKINVVNPDLKRFPQFRKAQRHTVTLSPGQVLFVPRHWWHYVESIDPVTVSINSWIELEEDHLARVEEAIARMLVCALKTAEGPHYPGAWLNPTEVEETSHEVNCCYLNGAVCAFFDHCKKAKEVEMQTVRANGEREEPSVQEHTEVEHDQSVTVESPHDQSVTVESPPHDQSVTVESPHDQSVTVESPHDQSVTVESPLHDQSVTVESPHDQSITVESPHDQSITVESPHDQSVTVESPHDQSVTVESPHDQSITVESPHDQSITVESPHDQSITVESPHDQSITVESPHDQSITVESPHDQSITVESPHDQSVTVESQDRSVTIESPHDQSVTVESPYDQSVTVGSPQDQSVTVKSGRQEAASLFSPNLVPVTPASEEGGGTLEGDSKECIKRKRDRELTAELPCAKRQQTSQGESAVAEQVASGRPMAPSRILVSTDDLLDCLVNPQVTKMVAQLLIQRKSL